MVDNANISKTDWARNNSEIIISLYRELNNVWKVGEKLNIKGQIVHKILSELGVQKKMNYFTDEDYDMLKREYVIHRNEGKIKILAEKMNRTTAFLNRKAKELGLTDGEHHISMKCVSGILSEKAKIRFRNGGHPRGMLGKKHTNETLLKFSENTKKMWADPNSLLNSEEHRQKISDRMTIYQSMRSGKNNYSRTLNGMITIGGREIFFRSSWEGDIAAYFEFLKSNNQIKEWEYEPKVFWFEAIKRGVRSYKPDFRITNLDDSQYYVEVKGWMDDKSKTKLKRMKIYYPEIKIDVIDQKRYKAISSRSSLIPNWGLIRNGRVKEFKKCQIEGCENKSHSKDLCRKHFYKIYKK